MKNFLLRAVFLIVFGLACGFGSLWFFTDFKPITYEIPSITQYEHDGRLWVVNQSFGTTGSLQLYNQFTDALHRLGWESVSGPINLEGSDFEFHISDNVVLLEFKFQAQPIGDWVNTQIFVGVFLEQQSIALNIDPEIFLNDPAVALAEIDEIIESIFEAYYKKIQKT